MPHRPYVPSVARPGRDSPMRQAPVRLAAGAALVCTLVCTLGCATGAEKMVRGGIEGGLAGTLEALNDPHNKELLRKILQDSHIKQSAHDLTEAITGGALDGVTDAERMKKIREASDAYIRTIASAVGKALDEDISPSVARGVGDVVGGTIASALRPENRQLARSFIDGVTRSTITAFMQSTSKGLRDDLGPALNKVLAQDLGPGLQRVIEDNLGPALKTVMERDLQPMMASALGGEEGGGAGVFARALTRQIVLGVNDGMSDLGISPVGSSKNGTATTGGFGVLGWIPWVLGVLLLILTIAVVRLMLTRRAIAADRARSEAMLVSILRAVKSGEEGEVPGPADFNTVIARARQQLPNLESSDSYLAHIITRASLPNRPSAPARAKLPPENPYADAAVAAVKKSPPPPVA